MSKRGKILKEYPGAIAVLTALAPLVVLISLSLAWSAEGLKDTQANYLWRSRQMGDTSPSFSIAPPYLDRNYYTTEATARLKCTLEGMPDQLLGQAMIVVKGPEGKILSERKNLLPETIVSLPLKDLPVGANEITVAVVHQKDRSVLLEGTIQLIKRKPRPGCEVKIDQFNRVVLKDGKPFFPFGMIVRWHTEEQFKRLAEAGHNTIVRWDPLPASELGHYMETAGKYGLAVVDNPVNYHVHISPASLSAPSAPMQDALRRNAHQEIEQLMKAHLNQYLPEIREGIEVVSKFPNLLAYYNVDEPNYGYAVKVHALPIYHEQVYQVDGYHPVVTLYARAIPKEPRAIQYSDILAYDIYVYPDAYPDSLRGEPNYMTQLVPQLKRRADSVHQVSWVVPMAEGLDVGRCPRILTPEEHYCQAYLAIIHGAKGLLYFINNFMGWQISWDALSKLAKQMKIIGPAVVAPQVPQSTTYSPGEFDFSQDKYPQVQVALFANPAGGYLLLAANSARYPVDATYTVPGLAQGKPVKRLFAQSAHQVSGHTFSDRLEAYGVRAYRLDIPQPPEKPLEISVNMKGYPELAKPGESFSEEIAQTKKKKNIMPNPLFEKMTVPGIPDYVRPYLLIDVPLAGNPGAVWAVETDHPWRGKYCIKMKYEQRRDGAFKCEGLQGVAWVPELEEDTPYVFSVYIRAAREGDQAFIGVVAWGKMGSNKVFKLTTEWKRYWINGMFPKGGPKGAWPPGRALFHITPTLSQPEDKDPKEWPTIWVDGIQMEAGTEPTEFTLD